VPDPCNPPFQGTHGTGHFTSYESRTDHELATRDIHTVAQQSQGRQIHFETVGQMLLGLPPENVF